MSSEVDKSGEQLEMDEEISVKEKLNPSPDSTSPSKVKFTSGGDGKNGEAKVDIDNRMGRAVGMSKEELMKYANDPFWVRLRMALFVLFWVIWFSMLFGAIVIVAFAPKCAITTSLPWWQKTTIYQVYVRSFKDSNGDGEGDIGGLISRLDYFKDLGIETLILSPIYPSEMADSGYDVTNFTDIDPRYGSLDDFDLLVEEMHKEERNMKIVIDFIPNHTSDRHPWFNASQANDPQFKDYYVWRNGTGTGFPPRPPNNWKSVNGGSAWSWSDVRNQYYLHQFLPQQPDLNLRNPEVRQALKDVLQFWLKRKVDGIRVDSISHLMEDSNFESEEVMGTKSFGNDYNTLKHDKTRAHADNLDLLKEWRKTVKQFGLKRILILESYEPSEELIKYYGSDEDLLIDLPLNFNLVDVNLDTKAVVLKERLQSSIRAIDGMEWSHKQKPWSAWVTGSHDKSRIVSRLGDRLSDGFLMLEFILPRNTPVVYYGDEIGMIDNMDIPQRTLQEGDNSRFHSRSPMQWSRNTSSAGFSDEEGVRTWLKVGKNYPQRNVEIELNDNKTSHIKVFKALVDLRKKGLESILLGKTDFPNISDTDNVFVMTRTSEDSGYLLAINMNTAQTKTVRLREPYLPDNGTVYLTDSETSGDLIGKQIKLSELSLQSSQSILIEFTPKRLE